jgi:hypothetical protein
MASAIESGTGPNTTVICRAVTADVILTVGTGCLRHIRQASAQIADSARVYAVSAQMRSCAQITLIGVPRLMMAEKPTVRKNTAPGES